MFASDAQMLNHTATIVLSVLLGVCLELGIHWISGRREAWDSATYWTIGLPIVFVASVLLGYLSERRAWVWTALVVPGQVATMMVRAGELGGLWPLTVVLSAILSLPFIAAAFVGSRLRPRRRDSHA